MLDNGWVNWYETLFGLPPTIVIWNSQLTSLQAQSLAHRGDEIF